MNLCITFSAIPSGTAMPDTFFLSAFTVQALLNPDNLDIATLGGENALRCPNGLRLTLPLPRPAITLRIGTWAGPARVEAFAADGTSLGHQMVHTPNGYSNLTVSTPAGHAPIHHLTLTEGNHEANLASACIEITVSD